MEYPEERYYKLNRFFLTLSGLWPYQSARDALILRTLSTIVILSCLFVQAMSILTSEITVNYLIEVTQELFPTTGALCQFYIRIIHTNKLKEMFDRMRNDWALQKTDNEEKIMHDYAGTSKSMSFCFTFVVYTGFVVYMAYLYMPDILDVIWPMNESRVRRQYFKFQYFVPEEKYISFIRLHIILVLISITTIILAHFTLYVAVTHHVCGMCELLGYRAERLFCVFENTAGRNLSLGTKLIYRNTAVFLQLHHNVIQYLNYTKMKATFKPLRDLTNAHDLFHVARYVGIIEQVHTIPFLIDLLGVLVSLSLTLTQVLTISDNMEQAIRSIIFANLQILYIALCNYLGQQIIDKSSVIYDKLYNGTWYNAIVVQQKPLLLIMTRRFQPLVLTACKFYVMSLQNFARILQTTMSYCMVLKQA